MSEPATVAVGGTPATVTADNRFVGQADVPEGTGQAQVTATDPSGNVRTSTYEVTQVGAPEAFSYDLNGNMTLDGARTYEWDAENRLVSVKEGATTVASFTYNHRGLRTSKTVAGVTTSYVLEDDDIVEERLSTGGVTKHFHGPGFDNVLAMQDGVGGITYLTRDHLGSVREYVDPAGVVTLRRDYDPWGNMSAGGAAGGWGYTGREWDAETGLYYYRARYYDPKIGRFISEDSAGGLSAANRYAYLSGNPINISDPSGHYSVRTDSGKFNTAVNNAMDTIVTEIVESPRRCGCMGWFFDHGSDLLPFLAVGTLPRVEYGKGWARSDISDTEAPWDRMRINYDRALDKDSCYIAGAILHELAHIVLQRRDHVGFQEFSEACSSGCITVRLGKGS